MHHPFRLDGPCLVDWSSSTKHQKQEVERKPLLATHKKKSEHISQTAEGKHAPHFFVWHVFFFGILQLRFRLNFLSYSIFFLNFPSMSATNEVFLPLSQKNKALLKQRAFSHYIYLVVTRFFDCLTCPKWLKLRHMIPS